MMSHNQLVSTVALLVVASVAGCSVSDVKVSLKKANDAGVQTCLHTTECRVNEVCLFARCSTECEGDRDCPGGRCLATKLDGNACVPADLKCPEETCPAGSVCTAGGTCRNECTTVGGAGPCLLDQGCSKDGVCVGTELKHDPEATGGGEGSGGSSGAGGERNNNAGGANASGGGTASSGGLTGGTGGASNGGTLGAGGVSDGGTGDGAGGTTTGAGGASSGGKTGTGGTTGSGTGGALGTGGGPVLGPAPTSTSASKQGPCTVQSYTSGVPSGADYTTPTVYYSTNCSGPFPGVVAVPGFVATQSTINQWGTFLASHGFVVMMIDAANSSAEPPARATALAEAVTTLKAENTRSGSPLSGKLDTSRIAIIGHSFGGGGTLLAANAHPELKAAIALSPYGPGVTYPNDTVPTLIFGGSGDAVVSAASFLAQYQSIPTTTQKVYAELSGGSHFVATTPLGTAATDLEVARIGLSWLEVQVVGDSRYQQFLVTDAYMSTWDMKP